MPYLPTTQAFLEQSALLLEAYPDTVRYHTQPHGHPTIYLHNPRNPISVSALPPPATTILISPTTPPPKSQPTETHTHTYIFTPQLRPKEKETKLTIPDSHHNKIQLPNRTPCSATQARKVPRKETSILHNRTRTNRCIHTKRPYRISHPEDLQPRYGRMPEVPHEQATGG